MSCNLINFKLNSFSTGASASYDLLDSQNKYIFVGMSASELSAGLTFSMSNAEKRMRLTGFPSGATVSSCGYVTTNLQIYYDAFLTQSYSGSGTTVTNLGSGSNLNATLVNGVTFTGTKPKFFLFDGTNDHATIPSFNLQKNFSIELVVFVNNRSLAGAEFYMTQGTANTSRMLQIATEGFGSNNLVYFNFYSNDSRYTLTPSQMNITKWQHWVFVYNDSTFLKQFYLNSNLMTPDAGAVNNRYLTTSGTIFLSSQPGPTDYSNNSVALLRIYDKILTPAEVTQNYNSLRGRFGSLLA